MIIIIFYINHNVKYTIQYTLMCIKKEIRLYKNDLSFSAFIKVLKYILVYVRLKPTYKFLFKKLFADITSFQGLNQLFNNIQKICIETFLLTLNSRLRQLTFIVTSFKTEKWRLPMLCCSVNYCICEITMKQDRFRMIMNEMFRIVISNMYIIHKNTSWS